VTYTPVSVIEVHAWGELVGAVALDQRTGFYAFEYAPSWIATGRQLAPLTMPLGAEVREFPELDPISFHRLPGLLADSLPDAFGNALVNHWMRTQGIPRDRITSLDRLAYAGDRALGALTFVPPADIIGPPPTAIEMNDLVTAARATVNGTLDEAGAHDALLQLINVGSSAGGARAKAVIAYSPETREIRSGHLLAPEGFSHWLIKLDGTGPTSLDGRVDALGAGAPYGRIEYAYFLMASEAGVTMSECQLLEENGRAHFLTRRFDRSDTGARVHSSTLHGLTHADFRQPGQHSYDHYLDAIRSLGMGPGAVAEGYRRMVFNVAAVNRDDHTKNVGFLLPQDGDWQLSPAYDVTHAFNPEGAWTQRHQMSINGKTEGITAADLYAVAERHDVPGYKDITRRVLDATAQWPEFARQAGIDPNTTARISTDLAAMHPSGVRRAQRHPAGRRQAPRKPGRAPGLAPGNDGP
jgi:serine/threonine-protein kinase HipA